MQARRTTSRLLTRLLARLLGESEARALQTGRYLKEVGRITGLFAASVLAPAVLLAYFALSSIQAQELVADAELTQGADALLMRIYGEAETNFARFESRAAERLALGESPLSNLSDLSPLLRGAFRFDADGALVAPFALPETAAPLQPSARYRAAWQRAEQRRRAGDLPGAAAAWQVAADATDHPSLRAQAAFARARTLADGVDNVAAERAFTDIYADFAHVRDERGFRIGDLAALKRAELVGRREASVGAVALEGLVEDLLAANWEIGRPGETAVARRALADLDGFSDPDWIARMRLRLIDRTRQLYWAERLGGELELLASPALRGPVGEWRYAARPESPAVWATLDLGDALYAFSFDRGALVDEVSLALDRAAALEDDLGARLAANGVPVRGRVLARRSLSPWVPWLDVVVLAADADGLDRTKAQKRRQRAIIIAVAVGMAVLGVILSGRLIGKEMETARAKADFAANVSHELRSPITQIRLKAEALQLDLVYDEADRQAHHDAIVRESERLSRLVDNILDFAAIERGAKTYTLRPEDPADVLYSALRATEDHVKQAGMELEAEIPDDLPVVWIDREAIGQVLTNLLSNAVKYGQDGKWLGVRAAVEGDQLELRIADHGIGISTEDQARLFEHFFRSADPNVRKRKGTGIGLTIVRYIVEEHGGTISVESALGAGTTFVVRLPLKPPEKSTA